MFDWSKLFQISVSNITLLFESISKFDWRDVGSVSGILLGIKEIAIHGQEFKNWIYELINFSKGRSIHDIDEIEKIKSEIKDNRDDWFVENGSTRVIIRNAFDYNSYLSEKAHKKYCWERTEIKDTYPNGVEFYSWIEYAMLDPEKCKISLLKSNIRPSKKVKKEPNLIPIKVFRVGRIPYSEIVKIKWNGDEYYTEPHFFCKFNNLRTPYEEYVYYAIPAKGIGDYHHISDFKPITRGILRFKTNYSGFTIDEHECRILQHTYSAELNQYN